MGDLESRWSRGQAAYEGWYLKQAQSNAADLETVDGEMRRVYSHFDVSGDILDVGGFPGSLAAQLQLDRRRYTVIDPMSIAWDDVAAAAPDYARHYELEDIRRLTGSAEDLPFEGRSFDVVNMRSVIDHFADPGRALDEARRVLRPDGRLIVGTSLKGAYRRGDIREQAWATLGNIPVLSKLVSLRDHHLFHPTLDGLEQLLSAHGFAIVQRVWQDTYHGVVYVEARHR